MQGGYDEELSYRKQIAPQLRTLRRWQLYSNLVTFKSRLRVTQDH